MTEWQGPAAIVVNLVRDGVPHQQTRNSQTVIKIWSWAPKWVRLTVGHNIILTFKLVSQRSESAVTNCESGVALLAGDTYQ
jgi:hypothetical protein